MSSPAEKTSKPTTVVQRQTGEAAFFRKAGEESFFGGKEQGSFFSPVIQTKLSVSSPDDPQEKEADAMADQVMRMPDPASAPAEKKEEEKLQKKEEDKNEEPLQAKQNAYISVQTKCASCEKENQPQAKLFRMIQRSEGAFDSSSAMADVDSGAEQNIHCKSLSLHRSDVIQRSGRGPPAGSIPFEQSLSGSKGGGSALPDHTREFMESRFNANFSGVRVHTGSEAQSMSRHINAQAFTHGNDIYFNSGKYSPSTAEGSTLLAHELTHTIQQGASRHTPTSPGNSGSTSGSAISTKPIAVSRKKQIQRSPGGVPSQLTNAVEKAKTAEGKIDANKPQADGNRTGWEKLVEIFKSTFGEEMVVSGGGGQGTVAEEDIKKKREQSGVMIVDKTTVTDRNAIPKTTTGSRDAMPSWCGIFVFWALNKSGVPMPKWKLGERMIKPEAARPPGSTPMPGDIAYRNAYSHFAIVESVNGDQVKTVNGNTAGEDNLGGQVQTKEHPLSDWTAFFNPLLIMEGSLGTGEGTVSEKPKTLAELRQDLAKMQRKEDDNADQGVEETVQTKPELSNWSVDAGGKLQNSSSTSVDNKTIQPKENEIQKEQEKDEEADIITQPAIQKKQDYAVQSKCGEYKAGSQNAGGSSFIQKATEPTGSSLNDHINAEKQEEVSEMDRGPPLQAKEIDQAERIQRSVIDDALAYTSLGQLMDCVSITDVNATSLCLLRKASSVAMHIPGYRALRVVLGKDPISGDRVERNGHNLLEAAFDIMPGGLLLHQKLSEQGQLQAAEAWIDGKIAGLESLVSGLLNEFDQFWNRLGITDFGSPFDVLREGAGIVLRFIGNLINFAVDAALELLKMIKDYLLNSLVNFIKENTTAYPLLTVILGEDPITKQPVERNGTTILNAILELGGEEGVKQRTQMQETGTFQKAAAYIDEGIAVFSGLYDSIVQNFSNIWDMVTIESLMNPVETFRQIYNIFAEPVSKVLDFMSRVGAEILKLIKEVLMQRLSAWARTVRGYALVTVIIGKDPFTDELVPFTMENVIKGFFSLMDGGEEQYNQLKETGAIDRTVGKITAAVNRLNMTPAYVVQLFIDLWNSFSIHDLMDPIGAFRRIIDRFGEPIGRLISFVVEIVKIVIEAILIVMNFPFDLINNIITRAMAAFHKIKEDPVAFLKNLLKAIKQGFIQFFDNIVQHLIQGLVGWLTSELKDAGVPELKDLSLRGIISWVLEVLGISMEKIWEKLAKHPKIGPAKVAKIRSMINTLEGIWTFIKDVQERGMAAIWDKIQEQLSNLWNVILDAVKNWIMEKIITAVVTKLLSMLDPTGIMAVVNSAIAIYKAVQSFIKYLREMLEIVNSFVNGVADIAEGNVTTAANYLERTMARAIPIMIGFLANQVGLGGVGKKIGEMIEKAREMVDKALDWLVNKAVEVGGKLLEMGKAAVGKVLSWLGLRKEFTMENGDKHTLAIAKKGSKGQLMIESTPMPLLTFINEFAAQPGLPPAKVQAANDAKTYATANVIPLLEQISAVPEGTDTTALERQLLDKMVELTNKLRLLAGESQPLSNHVDKYNLEGAAGTFASMPKPTRDDMTADHIPQNGLFEVAMNLGIFEATSPMAAHAANRTDAGYAMNEQDKRHKAGRTWGSKGSVTKSNFRTRVAADIANKNTEPEKKNAVVEAIKADKVADISALRTVYAKDIDDPVWQDIKALPLKQEDKITLQNKIRGQANAGLSLLNSQNLDALKV